MAETNPLSILVIDDDECTRTMASYCLQSQGYAVASAAGRNSILALLKAHAFDLVITDVLMPDIDGPEVIEFVRLLQPETPVLAMSGGSHYLTSEFCLTLATAMGGTPLGKPFTIEEFLTAVRDALQSTGHGLVSRASLLAPG